MTNHQPYSCCQTTGVKCKKLKTHIFKKDILCSKIMGRLLISRAECSAISARRRTTAHFTVVSTVLCTGYVVTKTVSCVLMNVILVTMI
jgi:hypothetical protein